MNINATIKGIYNLALIKLGISQFVVDPDTDTTLEVKTINNVYESVLNEVLELGEWRCARRRAILQRHKYVISAATQTKPVILTATGHDFRLGDHIQVTDVVGMTELNDEYFTLGTPLTANTIRLLEVDGVTEVDGTGYEAYVSGGVVWGTPRFGYSYEFRLPEDCIKVLETEPALGDWVEEYDVLLTNGEPDQIGILYLSYLTDPTYFSPLLLDTIATRLAYMVAPALVKDYGPKRTALDQEFAGLLRLARGEDARWRQNPDKHSALVTEV